MVKLDGSMQSVGVIVVYKERASRTRGGYFFFIIAFASVINVDL